MFKNNSDIVLASNSPRRIEFFKMLGIDVKIFSANIDEELYRNLSPCEMVQTLALEKARSSANKYLNENQNKYNGDIWFIGADTDVVYEDKSLGKPANEEEAFNTLKLLQGKTHKVCSAFSLVNKKRNIEKVFLTTTDVTFCDLSDDMIRAYIRTNECFDKAGAYAIQGISSAFIKSINGSYSSVIGLDVYLLTRMLLEYEIVRL